MSVEVCDECGFDGENWTDSAAVEAIGLLPSHWQAAIAGLEVDDVVRRPIPDMWSVGEYVDHVREVLFGMRFVLDSAVEHPGINLGDAPEPVFSPTPRIIDLSAALEGLAREAHALRHRLADLQPESWDHTAVLGGHEVDVHWLGRHAVHDATHHLNDLDRLRRALE